MPQQAELADLSNIVEEFMNHNGLWDDWKQFVEAKGWSLQELGFPEDE